MNPELQKSSFEVTMVTPIGRDCNVHHLMERLERVVRDEFREELATALAMETWGHDAIIFKRLGGKHEPMHTADYAELTALSPENARALLYRTFPDAPSIVTEYIREAEHQEGEEYWLQFTTLADLGDDFQLYWESID